MTIRINLHFRAYPNPPLWFDKLREKLIADFCEEYAMPARDPDVRNYFYGSTASTSVAILFSNNGITSKEYTIHPLPSHGIEILNVTHPLIVEYKLKYQ